ncbi:hypothetical protein ACFYUY_04320 [Kitasatospora sp. NPDC004745]|uniref:hypothetical protein n=1 Tax=Kitasatospora sp. NPDC004745 TaxID=3364019 RepID=UPI003673BCAA
MIDRDRVLARVQEAEKSGRPVLGGAAADRLLCALALVDVASVDDEAGEGGCGGRAR